MDASALDCLGLHLAFTSGCWTRRGTGLRQTAFGELPTLIPCSKPVSRLFVPIPSPSLTRSYRPCSVPSTFITASTATCHHGHAFLQATQKGSSFAYPHRTTDHTRLDYNCFLIHSTKPTLIHFASGESVLRSIASRLWNTASSDMPETLLASC